MTAQIISIRTRLPVSAPVPLVRPWAPKDGDRVLVTLPPMEGDAPADFAGTVIGQSRIGAWSWLVSLDGYDGRPVPVGLHEMRPEPTNGDAA